MSDQRKEYRIDGRPPTIFKVMNREDNPYVVMDRRPLENKNLSYKAKGILGYLLSRPDGWEVNVPDLINRGTDGTWSIRAGLKELREAGHIRYNPTREGNRIKKWVIEVYEVPTLNPDYGISEEIEEAFDSDFELIGFQQVENQHEENHTQVLSNLSSMNESIKTTTTATPNNFVLYESNIGALTPMIADSIKYADRTYSPEWVARAIEEAAKSNVRKWNYIEGILRGYKERGSPDIGRDFVKPPQAAPKNYRTANKKPTAENNEEIIRRIAQNVKRS